MATRRLQYVARGSNEDTTTLPDGTAVQKDAIVEVDVHLAHELLKAPGRSTDESADWIVAPKEAD